MPQDTRLPFVMWVNRWDVVHGITYLSQYPVWLMSFALWTNAVVHPPVYPHDQCGGDLPPCYVMMRESHGLITALNPSGAGGKWQIMPEWHDQIIAAVGAQFSPETVQFLHHHPIQAWPEEAQDAGARWMWAGGHGCSNWVAC